MSSVLASLLTMRRFEWHLDEFMRDISLLLELKLLGVVSVSSSNMDIKFTACFGTTVVLYFSSSTPFSNFSLRTVEISAIKQVEVNGLFKNPSADSFMSRTLRYGHLAIIQLCLYKEGPKLPAHWRYIRQIGHHFAHYRIFYRECHPVFLWPLSPPRLPLTPYSGLYLSFDDEFFFLLAVFCNTTLMFDIRPIIGSDRHIFGTWLAFVNQLSLEWQYQYVVACICPRRLKWRVVGGAKCSFGVRHSWNHVGRQACRVVHLWIQHHRFFRFSQ